jgi:hypothetical protein
MATLALLFAAGCGESIDATAPAHAFGRPIFYGTADTSVAHKAVVALTSDTQFFCSGTLITETVVLTAGHCLEASSPGNTQVFFGQNANTGNGDYRDVDEWEVHPQFDFRHLIGDIGIIRLASAAPAGISPIPHLPNALKLTAADAGKAVEFSGFGVTESGSDGAKLHMQGTISLVCPGPDSCSNGEVVPKSFRYSQGDGGPCSGDSGGPAFILRDTTEYVAGVTSYGDEDCTDYGVSTTVSEYAAWVESFVGGTAGVESCDNDIDDDGDGLVDCDDPGCGSNSTCVGPNACVSPTVVSCGTVLDATTVGAAQVFATSGCAESSSSRWNGPEVAFELQVPSGADVTAAVQPTGSGDLDLFLLPGQSGNCDTSGCLDASTGEGSTAETLSFVASTGTRFLLVDTWDTASAFKLTVTCNGANEVCNNGSDDDGDGQVDCADANCTGDPACWGAIEVCGNNKDDDGDGAADCADTDCATACQSGGGGGGTYQPTDAEASDGCRSAAGDGRWAATLILGLLFAGRRRRITGR